MNKSGQNGFRHIKVNGTLREIYAFDSMASVNRFCSPNKYKKGGSGFVGREMSDSWADVVETSNEKWEEGMDILLTYVNKLKDVELPKIKSRNRSSSFDFSGDGEFDFERFMEGEAFTRKDERESSSGPPTITITIDTSTPYHHDSLDILWRGAAALALAAKVEKNGYRAEIWVINGSKLFYGSPHGIMTACLLKRPEDPMDMSTLVNTVSGWFYRSITFCLLDSVCEYANMPTAAGYGPVYNPTMDDLKELSLDINSVYVSGVFSFNGAYQMVLAELEKFKTEV